MTPDDRRALADRLDRKAELNERTAAALGSLGGGWATDAADLRAAAAALREDADLDRISDESLVTAGNALASLTEVRAERDAALTRAEQAEARLQDSWYSDIGERLDAARAEAARLARGIQHWADALDFEIDGNTLPREVRRSLLVLLNDPETFRD